MKKAFAIAGIVLIVLAVAFGALLGYLGTANRPPRRNSNGWSHVQNMPTPRGEGAGVEVREVPGGRPLCPANPCPDHLVYVLGGIAGPLGRTVADVDVFDPPTNTWKKGPPLPEPRHHLAASVVGETIYATGGGSGATDFTPRPNVWRLDPGRLSWTLLVNMPEARLAHAMVTVGKKLYLVGGRGATSRVEIYDTVKATWTFGAEMPAKRDHAVAVAVDTKIYVIGGRSDRVTDRVDVYDTVADSWSDGPALPIATSGAAAAVLSDHRIHVIGGEDPSTIGGSVRDLHVALDLDSGTWSVQPAPLLAVHGAAFAEVGGRILIVGGSRRQGTLSVLGFTGFSQSFDPGEASAGSTPTLSSSPAPTVLPS